ncbi:MAG: sodium-extruding oxaloacetate decarboxylase subunit alpha [Gammaproteobacteria bacterium]
MNRLGVTEVCLRDGHQSLLATRLRTEDLLPVCDALDRVGFWSIECWGGATYDACIRYLGEDPWQRLKSFRKMMPNTRLQMLLRGQNLLGYRHYADDVVAALVENCAEAGIDVFRVFDALNDARNMHCALKAVKAVGKHAQGTLAYTTSPVHDIQHWLDLARRIEDIGVDSIAIKDMAGLLTPYTAFELVGKLKELVSVPIHMQCHATTGLSTATALKAAEAGLDNVDTSISSLSMTYGHSPTETLEAIFAGTDRATNLDTGLMQEVATYLRALRQRYSQFEGSLRGIDARILHAQVPGGMLSNLESQLRQQNALHRMDEVIEEIPKVRQDLGYIPLVTPSSQIVGAQALLNVLSGQRYSQLTAETTGLLRGEYGAAPAAFQEELQQRALEGAEPVTCRPADNLEAEMPNLEQELAQHSRDEGFKCSPTDVFTYAMFAQAGLNFLRNRQNPEAFEIAPAQVEELSNKHYVVTIEGQAYQVEVDQADNVRQLQPGGQSVAQPAPAAATPPAGAGEPLPSPLAGTVLQLVATPGAPVQKGQVLLKLEALKMETEISAPKAGTLVAFSVAVGDQVDAGAELLQIS